MPQWIEFRSGPNTLRGMLHSPDGAGPHPCVMLCHGFTGHRIEAHFLFVKLARQFARSGLAALRFDFAGSGESDGEFADMTLSGEVADAEAALEFVRRHPAVAADRVGVAGLSLGGAVAALLAGRRRADIRALGLLSAVAEPARILSFIRTGKFEAQLAERDYIDWDGLMVRRGFLQDLETHRPAEALAGYGGPVLIVHGCEDATVPPSEARTFQQARAKSDAPTRLEMIQDADHTYNNLDHTQRVCDLLAEFFLRHLKG